MSCLNTAEIRARLEETNLKQRLVVSPLFSLEEQTKPGQASIDVRLGFEFALVSPSVVGAIDELEAQEPPIFANMFRKEYVTLGSGIVIHPHQIMLATTLEYIRLPGDLMAYVVGRSTWGRLGLIVATAVGIHPFFSGSLTLELRNLGETPLKLYPGQTIAQLFFHEVNDDGVDTSPGQYGGTVDMIPQRISSKGTESKLRILKDKFKL
ncbi:MAG: dCTP deaminase [Candidatus Methylopumilus sp.]|jgi:dCTP deaminase